jgi:hypothetical protein
MLYQAVAVVVELALGLLLKLVAGRHLRKAAALSEVPQALVEILVKQGLTAELLLGIQSRSRDGSIRFSKFPNDKPSL